MDFRLKAPTMQTAVAGLTAAALAMGVSACGSGDQTAPATDPEATTAEFERRLADAPAPLAALYEESNELLEGGEPAFQERIEALRGYPIVVNKWASWCGPCRAEFPFFQNQAAERGNEIAFLGVDAQDNDDAALTFLEEFPLPYPSYTDPDLDISDALDAEVEFPSTIFFNSGGEQVYVARGGYANEAALAADIDRYADN